MKVFRIFKRKHDIMHKTKEGWYIWAIQNRHDGHCIYDAQVHLFPNGKVQAQGESEFERYGHGSKERDTQVYDNELGFMADWGLK